MRAVQSHFSICAQSNSSQHLKPNPRLWRGGRVLIATLFSLVLGGALAGPVMAKDGMAKDGAAEKTLSAHGAQSFQAKAWLEDYAQLKKTLEVDYANLAWMASPQSGVDLVALDKRTTWALKAARSDQEAKDVILAFVAGFHDGHFSNLPDLLPRTDEVKAKPQDLKVIADDALTTCAAQGFGTSSPISFSQAFEGLMGFQLLGDGLSSVYRIGLLKTDQGQSLGFIRIQNFRMGAFPAACSVAFAKLKAKGTSFSVRELKDEADSVWHQGLVDALKTLKAKGAAAVIIDVGNNSGGDNSGDLFPRILTTKTVNSARLLMIKSPAGQRYAQNKLKELDGVLARLDQKHPARPVIEAHKRLFSEAKDTMGSPCDMSWVWTSTRPWTDGRCQNLVPLGYAGGGDASLPKGIYGDQDLAASLSGPSGWDELWGQWDGPVYVLTNTRSYSSAEMFAAVVQDNQIGKIVGQKTGGDGCGFMDSGEPLQLTHSRMRFRMPNCVRLRADGRDEVAGVVPDLVIQPTEGEEDRARAARYITTITADLLGARSRSPGPKS